MMDNTNEVAISRMTPLSVEQRTAAEAIARKRIAGDAPIQTIVRLEDFIEQAHQRFSPETIRIINAMLYVLIAAGGIPSALRIFHAASQTTLENIGGAAALASASTAASASAIIVGLCSVLLAEAGMISFTLALAIVTERWMRFALASAALICAAFAFVGNAHVVFNGKDMFATAHPPFIYLEAFAPPALMLIASQVLKAQILHENAARFAAHTAFQQAHEKNATQYAQGVHAYERAIAEAHLRNDWMQVYAMSLKDALYAINRGKRETVRLLNASDWIALVKREMDADRWWVDAQPQAIAPESVIISTEPMQPQPAPKPELQARAPLRIRRTGATGGAVTGFTDNAVIANGDKTFTATCPVCGDQLTKDTERGARNALVAHNRKHQRATKIASPSDQ